MVCHCELTQKVKARLLTIYDAAAFWLFSVVWNLSILAGLIFGYAPFEHAIIKVYLHCISLRVFCLDEISTNVCSKTNF